MSNDIQRLIEQIKFPVSYDEKDGCIVDANGESMAGLHVWGLQRENGYPGPAVIRRHEWGTLIATAINNLQPKEEQHEQP
jgi:hypothetical protein